MPLIDLLLWLIVVGSIFGLLFWLVGFIGLPEPFNKVARVILAVIAVLPLINVLTGFMGVTPVLRLR